MRFNGILINEKWVGMFHDGISKLNRIGLIETNYDEINDNYVCTVKKQLKSVVRIIDEFDFRIEIENGIMILRQDAVRINRQMIILADVLQTKLDVFV